MALVINPFMSTGAKGSAFGMTCSMLNSGYGMKKKAILPMRMRSGQSTSRSRMGWLTRDWALLTDSEREAWKAYATDNPRTNAFGDPFIMSGINAFTSLNIPATKLGGVGAKQDLPPSTQPAAALNALAVTTGVGNPGEIDVLWTHVGTGLAVDFNSIDIAGPFQSPGRVEVHSRFAFVAQIDGNLFQATISGLLEGFWYWVRVRYQDQFGQVTNYHQDQATPMLTP